MKTKKEFNERSKQRNIDRLKILFKKINSKQIKNTISN